MKNKQISLIIIIMLLLSIMGSTLYASNDLIPISGAVLNDQLRFKLNNSSVIPVGDDGTPVLPISYNGTTYLPVRAVGYLLGLGIEYDVGTKTVLITSATSKAAPKAAGTAKTDRLIPISKVVLNPQLLFKLDNKTAVPVGDDGTPVLPISYNGTTYLPIRAIGNLLGLGITYDIPSKTVLITKGGTNSSSQDTGWYFTGYNLKDGSGKYPQGTAYDLTSFTGSKGNMEMSHNRYDVKTGKLLAGSTHRVIWSDPPAYLKVGEKVSINYETKQVKSTSWTMGSIVQQSVYFDNGAGIYFSTPDGTKYITKDTNTVLTTEKAIEKGIKGSKKTITLTIGRNYQAIYTYEWRE